MNKCKDLKSKKGSICAFYNETNGLCKLDNHYKCLEDISLHSIQLSHSSVQSYTRCKRLFWYTAIEGKILKQVYLSDPIKMGTLWGKSQEMIYNTQNEDGTPVETPKTLQQYFIESEMYPFSLAKVKGVYRAYNELLEPEMDNLIGLEQHFSWEFDEADPKCTVKARIHGYYDRLYTDHFAECKFTKDKKYYDNVFSIQSQVGTYFLANPKLEYVIMEIVQAPQLKPLKESKKREFAETVKEYEDRIYAEILRAPPDVFVGFDRQAKKFGLKFWRNEFDLNELTYRYKWIAQEIKDSINRNSFYIEEKNCFMYNSQCEYYDLCSNHGHADMSQFETRSKGKRH